MKPDSAVRIDSGMHKGTIGIARHVEGDHLVVQTGPSTWVPATKVTPVTWAARILPSDDEADLEWSAELEGAIYGPDTLPGALTRLRDALAARKRAAAPPPRRRWWQR